MYLQRKAPRLCINNFEITITSRYPKGWNISKSAFKKNKWILDMITFDMLRFKVQRSSWNACFVDREAPVWASRLLHGWCVFQTHERLVRFKYLIVEFDLDFRTLLGRLRRLWHTTSEAPSRTSDQNMKQIMIRPLCQLENVYHLKQVSEVGLKWFYVTLLSSLRRYP